MRDDFVFVASTDVCFPENSFFKRCFCCCLGRECGACYLIDSMSKLSAFHLPESETNQHIKTQKTNDHTRRPQFFRFGGFIVSVNAVNDELSYRFAVSRVDRLLVRLNSRGNVGNDVPQGCFRVDVLGEQQTNKQQTNGGDAA